MNKERMFNSFKGKKAGGWKDKKSFNREDRGPVEMHEASCAKCNKVCEVPFKPNGRKPVFCSDCFRRDDGMESRPSFSEKRSFRGDDRGDRFSDRAPQSDMAEVASLLRATNVKLDAILRALSGDRE